MAAPVATGIGSLPFRSLERARALIARFELPWLPELPNVEPDDLLLRRPFAGLLDGSEEPRLRAGVDLESPPVFGPGLALLEAVSAPVVKVQIAGPCVLGAWVKDAKGRPLGETAEGRKRILHRIELVAGTLLARLAARGKNALVFLDEPGLERPSSDLTEAVLRVHAAGGRVVGVHDCGPGFRHAIAAEPEVLSFDLAYFSLDRPIEEHLARGGVLALGAVSTTREHDAARALAALRALPASVLARALVTPACGTALLDEERAERVHDEALALARALSQRTAS